MLQDDALIISRLIHRIKTRLFGNGSGVIQSDAESLVNEGIPCNLLVPGTSQWVSGKVRLVLEFQPDEPEAPVEAVPDSESEASPLDEIRQTISDN
ncbi:MAG: hypothetical protein B0A82_20035 [Alkalinema sp. CACIAM 70d]|nr:MAG: hypothetical protein B0A82_20035 [Alkalinema sp. CACIAM 70d]